MNGHKEAKKENHTEIKKKLPLIERFDRNKCPK